MAAGVQLSDATRPRVAFARGFHATGAALRQQRRRDLARCTRSGAPQLSVRRSARFGSPGLRAKRPPARARACRPAD